MDYAQSADRLSGTDRLIATICINAAVLPECSRSNMLLESSHNNASQHTVSDTTLTLSAALQLITHVAQNRNRLLAANVSLFPDYIKVAKYKQNSRVDTGVVHAQIAELQQTIAQLSAPTDAAGSVQCDSADMAVQQLNNELINLHSTLHTFNTVYTDKLQPFVQQHLATPQPTAHELQIDTLVPAVCDARNSVLTVLDNLKSIKQHVADVSNEAHKSALQQLKPTQSHTEQIKQLSQQYNVVQQSIKRVT